MLHTKIIHGVKPFHLTFDNVDGYIKEYDWIKYVGLLPPAAIYERMFGKIRYSISQKSIVSDVCYDSDDNLPLENTYRVTNLFSVIIKITCYPQVFLKEYKKFLFLHI